jgi:murein DD-endopeptidase MepM/ murein hydrolase activator NlpD
MVTRFLAPLFGAVVVPSILAARLASSTRAQPIVVDQSNLGANPQQAAKTLAPPLRTPRPLPVPADRCDGLPLPAIMANSHRQNDGVRVEYEQIARRPNRPVSYNAYLYPVAAPIMVSGYDLDKPDGLQRRGSMPSVGHGGADLVVARGTPIRAVPLEEQMGDAEVLYVGHLFGNTVITRHVVRECGLSRDYIVIMGHLEAAAAGVFRGRKLYPGEVVGYVGDSASPRLVHLHLEVRRMRDGIDAWGVIGWELKAREISTVTDPRNLLPLR